MKLPLNKFTFLAAAWFIGSIYALLFKESGNTPPPFPNFDKAAHFAMFFAQIWLMAKSFLSEQKPIPYQKLLLFALLYAVSGEWAQATFTSTREGTVGDGIADMLGAASALWLAKKVETAKSQNQKSV